MPVKLKAPIEPGTRHAFLLDASALRYEKAIDYACGPYLLLHISIRDGGRLVVLNDRMGGTWGQEQRLTLPTPPSLLEVTLLFGTTSLEVEVAGQPPLRFARGADFGEVEHIDFADVIRFTQTRPAPPEAPPCLLPSPPDAVPPPAALPAGGIDHADVQHLSGWIATGPLLPGAALLAEVEGQEQGRLALEPWAPGLPHRAHCRIPFSATVADGQEVTLLLAVEAQRIPLHRARLASSIAGGLDRVSGRMVRGWAWNPHWPEAPVTVEILVNGEPAGQAVANRERPDLRAIDPKLAQCGFLFRLPEDSLPPGPDLAVSARVRGMERPLPGSPWPLARRLQPAEALCRAEESPPCGAAAAHQSRSRAEGIT
jgi:hypothetical protein